MGSSRGIVGCGRHVSATLLPGMEKLSILFCFWYFFTSMFSGGVLSVLGRYFKGRQSSWKATVDPAWIGTEYRTAAAGAALSSARRRWATLTGFDDAATDGERQEETEEEPWQEAGCDSEVRPSEEGPPCQQVGGLEESFMHYIAHQHALTCVYFKRKHLGTWECSRTVKFVRTLVSLRVSV